MKSLLSAIAIVGLSQILIGCQLTYLLKNSWHQSKLLKDRVPIKDILNDPKVPEKTKAKLRLAVEARIFAETILKLKTDGNYSKYVELGRDYVTWIVRAAPKYELKPYQWWFPITGHVPYKGYFTKKGALEEAEGLKEKDLDTYVRGVSAYSTLGWFEDPVLSSMLHYSDYDLVNLIIHESVHTTLFIKDQVDFNERIATFIGNKGAEIFFNSREGGKEKIQQAANEEIDGRLFSEFITKELDELDKWYKDNQGKISPEQKTSRIGEIQTRFTKEIVPKLKAGGYEFFAKAKLNNASLLSYRTYQSNFDIFQKLYEALDKDLNRFIEFSKSLDGKDNPNELINEHLKSLQK